MDEKRLFEGKRNFLEHSLKSLYYQIGHFPTDFVATDIYALFKDSSQKIGRVVTVSVWCWIHRGVKSK